jgi:hypothetical protein
MICYLIRVHDKTFQNMMKLLLDKWRVKLYKEERSNRDIINEIVTAKQKEVF